MSAIIDLLRKNSSLLSLTYIATSVFLQQPESHEKWERNRLLAKTQNHSLSLLLVKKVYIY